MRTLLHCLFGRHAPIRSKVWDDSYNLRSKCAGCHKLMLKDHRGWRLFVSQDHRDGRQPHPHAHPDA
ncbi:MAG: hypothetical protein ABW164_05055 [Sphingobium sp.]